MLRRLSLFAFLTFPFSTQAAVLFDNGTFNVDGARDISMFRHAENFVLAGSVSVTGIQFFYHWTSPAVADSSLNFSGTITYAFYQDNAGALGALAGTGTVSGLTSTDTGIGMAGFPGTFHSLQFDLPSALALTAGSYWLELHEGPTLSTNDGTGIGWAIAAGTGDAMLGLTLNGVPSLAANNELSFQLLGDVGGASGVPEPGSVFLSAAGIAVLALCRRKL